MYFLKRCLELFSHKPMDKRLEFLKNLKTSAHTRLDRHRRLNINVNANATGNVTIIRPSGYSVIRPQGYKIIYMLSLVEQEIYPANKC